MEPMEGVMDATLMVVDEDTVKALMTAMFLQLTLVVSHRQVMPHRLLLIPRLIVVLVMGVASDKGPIMGTMLDSLGHW